METQKGVPREISLFALKIFLGEQCCCLLQRHLRQLGGPRGDSDQDQLLWAQASNRGPAALLPSVHFREPNS